MQAESENSGVCCPRCGCRHLLAERGPHRTGQYSFRYRKCRHCGQRVRTKEVIDRVYGSSPIAPPAEDVAESPQNA